MIVVNGMKLCTKRERATVDGFRCWCKICRKKANREYYEVNKEKYRQRSRDWRIKYPEKAKERGRRARAKQCRFRVALENSRQAAKRYNHEPCNATIKEIKAAFNGRCHLCDVLELELNRRLHLDHCHKTGFFRGWLCGNCNAALGLLKDSPELTEKATKYLQQQKGVNSGKNNEPAQ